MNIFTQLVNSPLMKIMLTVGLATIIMAILPNTPFMSYLVELAGLPYLGYLNWVMPIGTCLAIMSAWWTSVIVFYAIRWILKQIDIIG